MDYSPLDHNLRKYLPQVQDFLQPYKEKRELGELAERLGIDQSRLSEFLAGKRWPTEYYIRKLVIKGEMQINQFLQGKEFSSLPLAEQEFWNTLDLLQDKELIRRLIKAREHNVNLINLLDAVLPEDSA